MKRKFRIVAVQVSDGRVVLGLKPVETEEIRPEDVIETFPSSEEDRIVAKLVKSMERLMRPPGMPQPKGPTIRWELTEHEYKQIGSPGVYQIVVLEFNITTEG